MVQQIEVMVGFVSKPKVIRDGQAAMCILRPPSKKELSMKENYTVSTSQSASSSSQSAQDKAPPAGNTDATEGSLQQ